MHKYLFVCVTLSLSLSAHAADGDRCAVSFAGAQMDVCSGKVSAPEPFAQLGQVEAFKDSSLRLIKFDGPIDDARRAAVEAIGAKIVDYAPYYAYVVQMPSALDSRARAIPGVIWSGPFLPAFKIDPNIAAELRSGTLLRDAGITELSISLHAGADRAAMQQLAARAPGLSVVNTVTAGGDTQLIARFERAQLRAAVEQLAADPRVSAIGFRLPRRLLNSQADWLHQSNVNSPSPLRPVFAKGLYGCGQTVGVLDSGLFIGNCAFNDATQTPALSDCNTGATCPPVTTPNLAHRKVPAYYKWSGDAGGAPADEHGHGTHVTGSIAGNNPANAVDCTNFTTEGGNTDLDGTAPGAKIVMQEMGGNLAYLSNTGNPYHAADMAYTSGARLHSNSWGGGCTNLGACISGCTVTYDAEARHADNIMRDRPELLVLFAAGNDASACPAGNNVGSPGNAKSVMTIGASLRGSAANGMASFSSRGPTLDVRTKPDLTAQGDSIVSAQRDACGTRTSSGTSMATPTAAGLAALVRDYLARGFYPSGQRNPADAITNPSGALIKAIMISGAFGMSGSGAGSAPGQSQGWGRILLDNSLYFNGDTSRLYIHDSVSGLSTGGQDTHTVVITAGQPFNATLAWTDAAAAIGASPALVNSLRLEVVAPNGDVWTQKLPAGATPANPNPTQDTTTANYDDRNTVQRISFTAPATGAYQLRVHGINVPNGPQNYALAATGSLVVGTDPDFALQVNPQTINICAGSPARYDVGAQSLNNFTSPVTLSVTGLPGSATGAFAPNPVTPAQPAAISQLTVANTGSVGSGSYSLTLTGNSASPPLQHTASATLNVVATAPAAGSLTAPANNATGQATSPVFSWSPIADAASYRIQVATDAGFTTLVENQVVTTTSHTPSVALSPDTAYFWRVYGINACGQGTVSAVFQFRTANEICRAPNAAIPDNSATGVTDSQTVVTTGTLNGLRLGLQIPHTYVGDLTLTLSKGATSVVFLQRPPNGNGGCSGNDINLTVDDAAVLALHANCTSGTEPAPAYISGSSYRPNSPLTAFVGQDLSGSWSLKAVDSAGQDTGVIARWCLLPDVTPPQPDAIFKNGFEVPTR